MVAAAAAEVLSLFEMTYVCIINIVVHNYDFKLLSKQELKAK